MITKWLRTTLLGFLAVVLIQCSPIDATQTGDPLIPAADDIQILETQAESSAPGQSNINNDTQMTPTVRPPTDPALQSLINQAKEDLAQRLSISIDLIILVEAKAVVWPDASLGCPQPGMKYKQVPEDGALITLQVEGVNYEYHAGGSRGIFLCEMVYKDPNKPTPIDITKLTPSTIDKDNPPPTTPDNSIPPGEDD